MDKPFLLQMESGYVDVFVDCKEFNTYDAAVKGAGHLFDSGESGDFRIVEKESGRKTRLRGYTFNKEPCPVCGKDVRQRDMERTYDCHGIPFRLVCHKCYDRAMRKGYDGQYYDSRDENFDYDY